MIVSSASELAAALKAAAAGDTIYLAAGSYGALRLDKIDAPDVTIRSLDALNPASFTGLMVNASSGLEFRDIDLAVNPQSGFAVQVLGSKEITLSSVNVHGREVGDGSGVMIRGSTSVTFENSNVHHLHTGVNHLDSSDVRIIGNSFHDIRSDGVRGGGTSDIVISGNYFTDFYPGLLEHPDAIQFWTTNTKASAKNITITDNVFVRGEGSAIQGIFVGNEWKIPYEQLTITGNAIVGGMYHGIMVSNASGVVVEDNLVQGFTDIKSWIMLNNTTGAEVSDNEATAYQVTGVNAGLLWLVNETISVEPIGESIHLQHWLDARAVVPVPPPYTGDVGADLYGIDFNHLLASGGLFEGWALA
jgi:nitrous oxidase accessory protein NosD